jgi:hypothetical protein
LHAVDWLMRGAVLAEANGVVCHDEYRAKLHRGPMVN